MSKNPFRKNKHFYVGVVLNILEGILSGFNFYFLFSAMQMLWEGDVTLDKIMSLVLLLLFIYVVRLIVYSTGYTMFHIGGAFVSRHVRLFLGEKIKKIPLSCFTQKQTGDYINAVTSDVSNYEKILTHKIGDIIKNISLSLMLVGYVGVVLWAPAGAILFLMELMLLPALWMSFRMVRKYGVFKNEICVRSVSGIVEYISGIQTFRAYGIGGIKNKDVISAMKDFSDIGYIYESKIIPIGSFFGAFIWGSVSLVICAGAVPLKGGAIDPVTYLMIIMLAVFLSKLCVTLFVDLTSYKHLAVSKGKIISVVNEKEEKGIVKPFQTATHEVVFDNVCFSYVVGEPVLEGISFCAPDKSLTAVVGDSGCGKSTIMNLISKYYEVESGSISFGGKKINNIAAERVLENISMVDQDVFLFNDTIRNNIRYARPDASDKEIENVCREAGCEGFILNMKNGYDTMIGENGNLLSGGERQRLSIARAILKNSPILILDEATASLDIENELAVKQAVLNLLKQKKTVIMIAHTLAIVKNADEILVVADGKIAEHGKHAELIEKNGKYAAMWDAEQQLSA
ncbi:ABC transporter related protein [Denitrovibrio acetiphilus DSM 12809]|uniref:ABC transporter related protein n=1 Tax=Denitrovibrio acetiphilus (strain DSM 12809 / NBRC 114555 / N2460) TaxID=522772 RepID=D4H689_DENA2|nr:ABC transporter ATP-binding protein [Denitrovibrio acetiphilus]ADD67735.1 ABC transporter related protein [Denitrovibrio acetiphilus DSM 12809]